MSRDKSEREPPRRIKVIEHYKFREILASQKYSSFNEGLCLGISEMGVSEFLAGHMPEFIQRLEHFADLSVEEFLKKKKLFYENDAKAFTVEERKKFANFLALLDGIELYLNPMAHSELFNRQITQFKSPEIYRFVESQELIAKGGRVEVDRTCGIYDKKELDLWLTTLHNTLMQQPKRIDLGITFFKKGHAFSLCFSAKTEKWTLIDSTMLEYVAHQFEPTDLAEVICEITRNFEGDQYMGLAARMVTTADQKEIADKVISAWHKQVAELEEITVEKANRKSNYGESLIHLATMANDSKMIQLLADKKTDLNKLQNGDSAVFDAVCFQATDALRTLGKNGVDLGATNEKGLTPLMSAAVLDRPELVSIFAEINPKLLNQQGMKEQFSALHLAACVDHDQFVKQLIEHGANIDLQASNSCTALHLAAAAGHDKSVKQLINHGANIDLQDSNGCTALYTAVSVRKLSTVKILLDKKADVSIRNNFDFTVVYLATLLDFPEAIDLLAKEYKVDVNLKVNNISPLFIAAQSGKINATRALLNNRASVQCAIEGSVAVLLQEAEKKQRTPQVEALLRQKGKGAIPDKIADFSPLHAAVFFGHYEIVCELVKADASLLQQKTFDITALEFAQAMDHKQIAEFLVQQSVKNPAKDYVNNAKATFLAKHAELFKQDKAERFGFFRRTELDPKWSLKQIIEHGMKNDNRTRKVCMTLGWLSKKGELLEDAPDEIKKEMESSSFIARM